MEQGGCSSLHPYVIQHQPKASGFSTSFVSKDSLIFSSPLRIGRAQ